MYMERRRQTPLDEYILTINEPPDFVNRRVQFYNDLRHFYRRRWGCPMKVPAIHGVDVDLFRLYEAVINLGGWQKVSNAERWTEVLREIGFGEDIQMSDYCIRMIYMRYLSKFEQSEFGNENDDHDNELLSSRGRLKNMALVAHAEVPVSIPRSGATDAEEPDYKKILRSLMSGLSNEVDFALNICTILSHPGPYLLRLADCPHILTAFVAHCGVFADGDNTLADVHLHAWRCQSGHDFGIFWRQADIKDAEVRALIAPILDDTNRCVSSMSALNKTKADESAVIDAKYARHFCTDDKNFDLKKTTNWRVFQILSICRNLSFEECNRSTMASNVPLLKFLIACCHTKYQVVNNNAFDTLSNIACEIDLNAEGSVFEGFLLLKTVSRGLFSSDRFEVLRSLEIITGLCRSKNNEFIVCDFMSERVLTRIFALITVKDITLCLFTLESLYQMSEMGRTSCELISQHNRAIDILVDLATTDAASFGIAGLGGIKVVEIDGVTGQCHPYQPQRQQSQAVHGTLASARAAAANGNGVSFVRPLTTMNNSVAVSSSSKPIVPRHQVESQHQNYVPVQPSPLVTAQSRPMSTFAAQYSATPVPAANIGVASPQTIYQYVPSTVPAVQQSMLRPVSVHTPLTPTSSHTAAYAKTSHTIPKSVIPPGSLVTPSSTRGKRFTSGLRNSSLRSKEKAATKAASMRAVQEVVAAMSSSINRKENEKEETTGTISEALSKSIPTSGESRLEHLTRSWIIDHCLLADGAVANRGEIYAAYVEHIQNTKNASGGTQMLAGGMQMFINQLKAIFPFIVITHSPGSTIHAVEGIRFCKDGVQNNIMTGPNNTAKTSEMSSGLLMPVTQSLPSTANANKNTSDVQPSVTTCKIEDNNYVEKKSLSNGFIHDNFIGKPVHQNGNDEPTTKSNGVQQQTLANNNNGDSEKMKNVKNNNTESAAVKASDDNIKEQNGGGSSSINNVGDILTTPVKEEKSVVDSKEDKNNADSHVNNKRKETDALNIEVGGGDATATPVKYLADELEEQKFNIESAEDKVSSTIDSLLKSTSNSQISLTTFSSGRGKRRGASNGYGRGFAKRAKMRALSPKTTLKENNNDGTVLPNGKSTAVVVVGQPVTMAEAASSTSAAVVPSAVTDVQPVVVPELMCEWDCCGRLFTTPDAMLFHHTNDHLGAASTSKTSDQKFVCRWPACDTIPRSKWSITTHLQDHHCTEPALKMAFRKRTEMGSDNYLAWVRQRLAKPPASAYDVGASYSRFSAIDAIRRHALTGNLNEITDDSEGPVTRSMRLTSCLVLRNVAKHSVEGRRKLRKYESHLCRLALSKMESNGVLGQALAELNAHASVATLKPVKESASDSGDSQPATPATPAL